MITVPKTGIKDTAELLLMRPINTSDGLTEAEISKAESTLGYKIPQKLKDFYALVGKNNMFMDSYNHVFTLDKLEIIDNKLVFMDENQGVVWWGIAPNEENPIVYQQHEEGGEWYSMEVNLEQFLCLTMFFQAGQEGGYQFGGSVFLDIEQLKDLLAAEWEKVVEHNGLLIYHKPGNVLWCFIDDEGEIDDESIVFASIAESEYEKHIKQYDLNEL